MSTQFSRNALVVAPPSNHDALLIKPDSTRGLVLRNGVWAADMVEDLWSFPVQFSCGAWPPSFTLSFTGYDKPKGEPPALPTRKSETPLVGYRTWDVERDDNDAWGLVSPTMDTEWPGPVLRADGKPSPYDPHRWTGRDDLCHGIYAHNEPEWDDFGETTAMGAIEMTGRVVVHERGFRAESARIVRLVLHPALISKSGVVDALAARYACDVSFDPITLIAKD